MALVRTQAQIDAEIAALRQIKPLVRRLTLFGEDNHAKIDAQIAVLEDDMDESDIFAEYDPDGDGEGMCLFSAREARDWLDGTYELDDGQQPWEGGILAGAWSGLIGK